MKLKMPPQRRGRVVVIAALFTATLIASIASVMSANADGHVRELVRFTDQQFPEGLSVAPDGTILVGIASTGQVLRVTPNGSASQLAQVPLAEGAFLLGVAAIDSSSAYALVSAGQLWRVSQNGASQVAEFPADSFTNDLVIDSAGQLYVTETIGGGVFRVQPDGSVEQWAQHPLLLGNVEQPGPLGFPIGANGIDFTPAGDGLYVSVSEGARIVRIAIEADGTAGPATVVAEDAVLNGADGIDVDQGGRIYVAVNSLNQVARVEPATGAVEVVASGSVFRSPASVRLSPDGSTLYATNLDIPVLIGLAPGPPRTGLLSIAITDLATQVAPITPPATGSGGLAAPQEAR